MAEAREASERAGDNETAMTALFHLCRLLVFAGDLRRAYDLCRQALTQTGDMGGAALPMVVLARVSLGRILIEWNRLDEAADHLEQAVRLTNLTGFVTGTLSSATMMLAEVQAAQGNADGANAAIADALAAADRCDPAPEAFLLKAYAARLWLAQGNLSAAADWAREAARFTQPVSLFYPPSIAIVARARVLLAQRKPDEAISMLTRLVAGTHDLLTVEALGVLALARYAQGDSVHAALALEQALTLAEPQERVRAFLDLGQPMAKLLAQFADTHPDHDFARRVLSAFPHVSDSANVEPLSERELEVLRLIVAGNSNDEIAQTLTLAVSTVKWYVNTLYSKLHVKTRAQAIARAHALRLVEH
jgi:LuxR family maltose regulon positive regulatory protein